MERKVFVVSFYDEDGVELDVRVCDSKEAIVQCITAQTEDQVKKSSFGKISWSYIERSIIRAE